MEGIGIWIFLLLFYLLQALTKRKQKQQQQRQQQPNAPRPKPQPKQTWQVPRAKNRPDQRSKAPQEQQKKKKPITLEDLFNPDKLRDILGVPQPEAKPKPVPQPVAKHKVKTEPRQRWQDQQQHKPSLHHEEVRETGSRVASADITDVDESAARFKGSRLGRSDITSDYFDKRKEAPGTKKKVHALDYFDEPEDIRHAIILKEILDRPRAFRRQIR